MINAKGAKKGVLNLNYKMNNDAIKKSLPMESFKNTWFLNFVEVLVSVSTTDYKNLDICDVNIKYTEDNYLK